MEKGNAKKYFVTETCYSTVRIWVEQPKEEDFRTLDFMSCWKGSDKKFENGSSWEIPCERIKVMHEFMKWAGYKYGSFEVKE